MEFSRETLAAFSNVLATLHSAAELDAALRQLLADLSALFGGCRVSGRRGDTVVEFDLPSQPTVADPDAPRHELVLELDDPPIHIVLRRAQAFSDQELFLAQQLRTHLGAATKPRVVAAPAADGSPPAQEPAAAHWRQFLGLGLTPRECEVLHWIMCGKRDAEIAGVVGAAPKTVSKHVENILRKLGAETRLAAAYTGAEWLKRRTGHPTGSGSSGVADPS